MLKWNTKAQRRPTGTGCPWEDGPRAVFTEAGLRELRLLLQDRRAMDLERFAHLRRELGLDAGGADAD